MQKILTVLILASLLLAGPIAAQGSDVNLPNDLPTVTNLVEKIVPSEPEMKKIPKPPVFQR